MNRLLKKVFRDLLKDKRKAVFSLFAILIGTMSFGIVTFAYQIIPRELLSVYESIIPASASVMVDRVDTELIELTNNFDGITIFEQRASYDLRVLVGDNHWKPLELFSTKDFNALKINRITSERGSFQPGVGEVLIERDAVKVANAGIGDTLTIFLPNGYTREFTITGIVADIILHPASVHDSVYVYVSYETLLDMGLVNNQIDFIVTGSKYDREHILAISNEYIKILAQNGYKVTSLDVSNTPGISMHLEEYEVGLFLLRAFSFVTFLFGCMIMSSLISSIISGQTRQIGILKGIGASTNKITAAYMLVFFCLILLTATISVTLSTLLAGGLSSALMSIGNMHPADTSIPIYLYVIYCGFALIVPMGIAYFPVRRGVNISVKDAVNDFGLPVFSGHVVNRHWIKMNSLKLLSRPVMLSLRNAVRRKNRFLLNIAILSLAGAMFVAVVTSMISMQTTMSNNLETWKFDYMFTTNINYSENELAEIIAGIPNAISYEKWGISSGILVNDNGELTSAYRIQSPPDNSFMIEPEILEGRWIKPCDSNQVVVSHRFFIDEPGYQVGSTMVMQAGNIMQEFVIVGSIRDFGKTSVFISESGYDIFIPTENRLYNIKLNLEMSGRRNAVHKAVNAALSEQGVLILQTRSKTDLNAIVTEHYAVTMQTFLLNIILLVIVSSFGLAATMKTQSSERIKEIGIMKAMGAGKRQIAQIITAESIFIALVSWGIAILLGLPFGVFSVHTFGNFILETPLQFSFTALLYSYIIWFLLTLAIGYLASRSCAKQAARMSIKDSLLYE